MITRLVLLFMMIGTLSAQGTRDYLRQASAHEETHEWQQAIGILKEGVRKYPEDLRLLLRLAGLKLRTGQVQESVGLLETVLSLDPQNSEAIQKLGEAQMRQGHFGAAVLSLGKALNSESSREAETLYLLAKALFFEGRSGPAVDHARQAVEKDPANAGYRHLYSIILESENETEESYRQLRAAQRLAPRDARFLFQLSERHQRKGEPQHAIEYLELASQLDPENPLYHRRLAILHQEIGDGFEAALEEKKADRLSRAFQDYIEVLRLAAAGREEQAIEKLQVIVGANPEFLTGKTLLADVYEKQGKKNQAFDLYLDILKQDPLRQSAAERGAWIQMQAGAPGSALELLRDFPASLNAPLFEGYRQLVHRDWEQALKHLQQAQAQIPLDSRLLKLISFCLSRLGRNEEALGYLARAGELQPADLEVSRQIQDIRIDEAFRLFEQQKWQAAAQAFTQLIRDYSLDPEFVLRRAYCLQQLQDLEGAVRDYRVGLKGKPEAHWARINLENCLYSLSVFPRQE